ncbi:HAMP domain-containing histidine kinase [Acetobacteraceae bacterium H6797]|nr:HAMP domain-containing histidine kinase [Acetobacteraceae bacterium H6797]
MVPRMDIRTFALGFTALLFLLLVAALLRLRQRLSEALERAAKAERSALARGRCLGLVARELQAPGLAVLGHAARLSVEAPHAEADARAVEAYARHLLRVADDIADFAASEGGQRHVRDMPLELGPVICEAIEAVTATLGPSHRHFRVATDLARLTLMADARALRGALREVLSRAARATADGDAIELRLVLGAEAIAIVVEDEGAGLPAGDLEAAMADMGAGGGREGTRGLALGLALARDLMRAHGGELVVESASGIGARSWLTLPRGRLLGCPVAA